MRSLRALRIVGIGLAFAAILASGGLPGGSQGGQEELPPFVLATNYIDSTVSFIDLVKRQLVTNIPVCRGPIGIDVHPSRLYAYVACWDSGAVSVISTAERRGVFGMSLGGNPYSVAFRPDGDVAYVVDGGRNNIVVIDSRNVARPQVLTRISLPAKAARNIDFTSDGLYAYVGDSESDRFFEIDATTHQLQRTLQTGGQCSVGIEVNIFGNLVYIADRCLVTVYAFNRLLDEIKPIRLGGPGAWHIAFSLDDLYAYVTRTEPRQEISDGKISIIDTFSSDPQEIGAITIGGLPAGIDVLRQQTPDGWVEFLVVADPTRSVIIAPVQGGSPTVIPTGQKTLNTVGSGSGSSWQDKKGKQDKDEKDPCDKAKEEAEKHEKSANDNRKAADNAAWGRNWQQATELSKKAAEDWEQAAKAYLDGARKTKDATKRKDCLKKAAESLRNAAEDYRKAGDYAQGASQPWQPYYRQAAGARQNAAALYDTLGDMHYGEANKNEKAGNKDQAIQGYKDAHREYTNSGNQYNEGARDWDKAGNKTKKQEFENKAEAEHGKAGKAFEKAKALEGK